MSSTEFSMKDSNGNKVFDIPLDIMPKVIEAFKLTFKKVVTEAAEIALAKAKMYCPKETGDLENSIMVRVDWTGEFSARIVLYTHNGHAFYNEFGWLQVEFGGTSMIPKFYKGGYRPYMRPAILAAQKHLSIQLGQMQESTTSDI